MGTYDELISSSSSFTHLLGDIHQHQLEEQQSVEFQKQQSIVDLVNSETDDTKDTLTAPVNVETKQEGIVKWHVYAVYLRAGAGLCLGVILMTGIFCVREFIAVFSDRWLGRWSDEETHRYGIFNNCTKTSKSSIQLMNDTEWNNHRNHRFYIYSGIFVSNNEIIFKIRYIIFLGSVLVLLIATLIRVVITEFIFLNAGRVLHNKYLFSVLFS